MTRDHARAENDARRADDTDPLASCGFSLAMSPILKERACSQDKASERLKGSVHSISREREFSKRMSRK